MQPNRIRVCLVNEQVVVREGLRALIDRDDGYSVIAHVGTCSEVPAVIERERPDLLVVDDSLPDASGSELIDRMSRSGTPVPVLLMARPGHGDAARRAINAGAHGYLPGCASVGELFEAMRVIALGGFWIRPVARAVTSPAHAPALTGRERAVVNLMARGGSNETIAEHLHISVATVKTHVYNLMQKLDARNRSEAAHKARRHGWIVDR